MGHGRAGPHDHDEVDRANPQRDGWNPAGQQHQPRHAPPLLRGAQAKVQRLDAPDHEVHDARERDCDGDGCWVWRAVVSVVRTHTHIHTYTHARAINST